MGSRRGGRERARPARPGRCGATRCAPGASGSSRSGATSRPITASRRTGVRLVHVVAGRPGVTAARARRRMVDDLHQIVTATESLGVGSRLRRRLGGRRRAVRAGVHQRPSRPVLRDVRPPVGARAARLPVGGPGVGVLPHRRRSLRRQPPAAAGEPVLRSLRRAERRAGSRRVRRRPPRPDLLPRSLDVHHRRAGGGALRADRAGARHARRDRLGRVARQRAGVRSTRRRCRTAVRRRRSWSRWSGHACRRRHRSRARGPRD